jgi:hypothetical protein
MFRFLKKLVLEAEEQQIESQVINEVQANTFCASAVNIKKSDNLNTFNINYLAEKGKFLSELPLGYTTEIRDSGNTLEIRKDENGTFHVKTIERLNDLI